MKRLIYIVALIINSPLAVSGAQSIAQVTEQTKTAYVSRKVNLDLHGVTVETAIRAIADQAGLMPVYPTDVVPKKLVSIKANNISAGDALSRVLQGSGLAAEISASGVLGLVKAAQGSRSAQGIVAGRITDAKTGKGIAGASVAVVGQGASLAAVSDENGSYRLNVGPGTHTISVRLVGYAKQTRSINVGEGITVSVDFRLEPSASVLNDVVVTGTIVSTELKAVPNAITVITAKQIEERGITRIDQLFRGDIPGLFSLNVGSRAFLDEVTMFSRGATALSGVSAGTSDNTNPIKTYVDGIEMADSKYLSQIDPSSIERIELLAGPQASTIYGANAINGVMQIFTKRGQGSKPKLSLGLSVGTAQNNFSSHLAPEYITEANLSGIEGRLSYSLGSTWSYAGSWTPGKRTQRLSFNSGTRIERGIYNIDFSVRRGVTQNKQNGSERQGEVELYATGIYLPTATAGLPNTKAQSLVGRTVSVSAGFRPTSWWSHNLGAGSDASTVETIKNIPAFTSTNDTLLLVNPSTLYRVSQRYSNVIQVPVSTLARLDLTTGGDHWRTSGSSYSASPRSLTGALALTNFSSPTRTHAGKNTGAFVQGQLSLLDALFFTYGVRADWNPNYGDKAKVRPGRYGVSYTKNIGLVSAKLRGSYGRSIRPPSPGQALAVQATSTNVVALFGPHDSQLANPDLGPEFQQGGEGGIEMYLGNRGSLIVTRYNQTVDNLISLLGALNSSSGIGLDSVRSIMPAGTNTNCSSQFRDTEDYCYRYQRQYINVGSIRNQGWELQGSLNLGPLTTRGTYSWTKSRILGITPRYRALLTGTTFEPGRPFDLLPEHTWALGVSYARAANSALLSINGIGARYVVTDLSVATGSDHRIVYNQLRATSLSSIGYRDLGIGYATADLNVVHRFTPYADATLQVVNLTNYYENDMSLVWAAIGRQTKMGFRIRM